MITTTRSKRPNETTLPKAAVPQVAPIGRRKRGEHLSKYARVKPGTMPKGLRNVARGDDVGRNSGRSPRGLTYRNAVFQALLNTPMLVNFAALHYNRWEESKKCPIASYCLACHIGNFKRSYWIHQSDVTRALFLSNSINEACERLWEACKRTFWPRSLADGPIGPRDIDHEFAPDTFLLHLLAEMRSQLEHSPSEFQTFEKMFTIHTARRWKCTSSTGCRWMSTPFRWESSLHLDVLVQKHYARTRQTPVHVGIERALRSQTKMRLRRGSSSFKGHCEKCHRPVESVVEIINLPEILIAVRNTEELSPADDPDIPFQPDLDLIRFVSTDDSTNLPAQYELISGIGELRSSPTRSRSCAFVRGTEAISDEWFCIVDEQSETMKFPRLEGLQRSIADGGYAGDGTFPMCPEIFIYRRKDAAYPDVDTTDPFSPVQREFRIKRELVARSINDIFTQKIGRGLLKFHVDIAPADPGPQDSIEVDLKLSYEFDGKQYAIRHSNGMGFIGFRMLPVPPGEPPSRHVALSPTITGRVVDRLWQNVGEPATEDMIRSANLPRNQPFGAGTAEELASTMQVDQHGATSNNSGVQTNLGLLDSIVADRDVADTIKEHKNKNNKNIRPIGGLNNNRGGNNDNNNRNGNNNWNNGNNRGRIGRGGRGGRGRGRRRGRGRGY